MAYDQRPVDLTDAARDVLAGQAPVILPLFSPRTAAIFKGHGPFSAPLYIVAMSEAVRESLVPLPVASLQVSAAPTAEQMALCVVASLRQATVG